MIFWRQTVGLGDKPIANRNVMNCLLLVILGLTSILSALECRAGGVLEARLSSGLSKESNVRQLSCGNSFPGDRQPEYRVMARGFPGEGFLSSSHQSATYLRIGETYINYDYGYSVVIPKPLVGLQSPPPFPNHGFVINLSEHPLAVITVDASYNAAEWNSLQEGLKAAVDQFKRDSSGEVKIVTQRAAVLGGLRAVHFSLRSSVPGSNEPVIRDVLLAFRNEQGEVGIVYKIALTTLALRYQKDRRSAAQLVKSFRLKALPK